MRLAFALTLAVIACSSSAILLAQSSEQPERIAASFLLALGRAPSAEELAHWAQQGDVSIAQLIARHRERLQADPAVQRAVATKAERDAFGRVSPESEVDAAQPPATYTELVQQHLRRLAERPAEYEQVIRRAYQTVVRRDAYDLEFAYWQKHDTLSYTLLVGCVEDWARRNQPGLMVTAGTPTVSINSEYLATIRLSPAIAQEAREAAGWVTATEGGFSPAFGRNLIAPGGAKLVTGGRIAFAAAGR